MARFFHFILHLSRDRDLRDVFTVVAEELVRLVLEEIHDALEIGFGADRELDRDRVGRQPVDDRLETLLEAGAGAVELVNKADARHFIVVRVAPVCFGLRFNAGDAVEDDDRAIQDAQRTLHLDRKVDVARGIDQVDLVFVRFMIRTTGKFRRRPERGRRGGRDRDAALALLLHPVHHGLALVHLADLVRDARVEEHALGSGGLSCVDVGNDTEVSNFIERIIAFHVNTCYMIRLLKKEDTESALFRNYT